MTRLRVGIVGAGKRVDYLYCPMVRALAADLELVGIWSRGLERAREIGLKHGAASYDNLDRLIEEARPDLLIVSVSHAANGAVGRRVASYGLPLLVETPIANDPADADAIIALAREKGAPIEVAEQYFRRPMERIKQLLLREGIFGPVNIAFNDCMGHAYHGISLIRSYVGFDVPAVRVSGEGRTYPVAPHLQSTSGQNADSEKWEHGVITFANGALGVFDWTSLGYGSALRWQRSSRFFAARGMAVGDELTVLSPDGKSREPIRVERRIHNIGGMEVLAEVVAHTQPQVYWRNPFGHVFFDDEMIAEADCLMSLVTAIRSKTPPAYGPEQGKTDQAIYVTLRKSIDRQGEPVAVSD